ncbi:MAG: hypothetical protein EBV20_09795 [Betaproteobacteria bacterium]|jgi:hypothetical protein|nr:hypothetical protein [Betaproteobacteria bacterium]NBP45558.1 hypothetical protein [Betaproteobacteria bacterium]
MALRSVAITLILLCTLAAHAQNPAPLSPCAPNSRYLDQCMAQRQYANHVSYSGAFVMDKPEGIGTMSWGDGVTFSGVFKAGRPTKNGFYKDASGKPLTGMDRSQVELAYVGTLEFSSGNRYEGEYRNSKPHGKGTYFYRDGSRFTGQFVDGVRTGQGTEYDRNGVVTQSGEWRLDELVRSDTRVAQSAPPPASNPAPSIIRSNERRIALVIGNGAYTVRPLNNPVNDANDISAALKRSGFQVIDVRNANLTQMRAKIREFGDQLINSDVGLVYYSGHGVELKGRNYLIPVNADIQREDEIADQGLDAGLILEKMNTAGKGVNILVVDACRDDPFGRSFRSTGRGLAQMDAPKGTIIAYSTSPGKVASDGDPKDRNSPYTKHLLRAMQIPNIPIEQVFKEVRRSVQAETKNQQTPWENTSLSGDFYFRVQR